MAPELHSMRCKRPETSRLAWLCIAWPYFQASQQVAAQFYVISLNLFPFYTFVCVRAQ